MRNGFSSIIIPKSIKTIGGDAFQHGYLKSVVFEAESNLVFLGKSAFDYNPSLTTPVLLPTSAIIDFVNYYDSNNKEYAAGDFINFKLEYKALWWKTIDINDVFDENTGYWLHRLRNLPLFFSKIKSENKHLLSEMIFFHYMSSLIECMSSLTAVWSTLPLVLSVSPYV